MPLQTILITDTVDQLRQKMNLTINQINTLTGLATVASVASPSIGQMLVYNGSAFHNVTVSGDITIEQNGVVTVVSGTAWTMTKGRLAFAGAIRGLYETWQRED